MKKVALIISIAIAVSISVISPNASMGNSSGEDQLKAAFIYNFAKLTKWPEDPYSNQHISICFFSDQPLNGQLTLLEGKKVKNTLIKTGKYNESKKCHITFVDKNSEETFIQNKDDLKKKNVLTVGDFSGFVSNGGGIELFRSQDKVNFYINIQSIKASGLSLNARLLKLGKIHD